MHPRSHHPQPATNPAHESRADAWGSGKAVSGLYDHRKRRKIKATKVNTMAFIRSTYDEVLDFTILDW